MPDPFEEKLVSLLEEHGVSDWMFAYRDPDSNATIVRKNSHDTWLYGTAKLFMLMAEDGMCNNVEGQ